METFFKFNPSKKCKKKQTHVHEFLGSVKLAEEEEERHNHRFAGVSSQAIPINDGSNHVHELFTSTDFFEDHLHEIIQLTGPAIAVSDDKHVHFAQGVTTVNDDHSHDFVVATLIESPLTPVVENGLKIGRKLFKKNR